MKNLAIIAALLTLAFTSPPSTINGTKTIPLPVSTNTVQLVPPTPLIGAQASLTTNEITLTIAPQPVGTNNSAPTGYIVWVSVSNQTSLVLQPGTNLWTGTGSFTISYSNLLWGTQYYFESASVDGH
jgi:hypothetical protein